MQQPVQPLRRKLGEKPVLQQNALLFICQHFALLLLQLQRIFLNDIAIIAAKYKLGEIFYEKTVWIARTAVCLALLIAIQFLTKSLGQLVTGSCVNLVLAIAALIGGVWSGVTVAVISPFCAYLLGIGPAFCRWCRAFRWATPSTPSCLPCLSADSCKKEAVRRIWQHGAGCRSKVCGAVSRPCPAGGPGCHPGSEAQHRHSGFTWPQLLTAVIGGVLACLIAPVLCRALEKKN